MAIRKASSYSHFKARPYTRKSAKKSKSYIKSVPPQKIVKLNMGNIPDYEKGKFQFILRMIAKEDVQMRDNALEASRQFIHKELETDLLGQYYFGVRVFPHHILRENKMLTGAGADRMQTGMALSFGATVGRAALIKKGGEIFVIAVNSDKGVKIARTAMEKIKAKLPCTTRILTEKKVVAI